MAQRIAVFLLMVATVVAAASYGATLIIGAAPAWAPWGLAFSIGVATVGLFLLGAMRNGQVAWPIVAGFIFTFVAVTGSFWLALGMPAMEGAGGPLMLGMPRRTAIVLIGAGLLPTFVLPLLFAVTFRHGILSEEDIARVIAARDEAAQRGHI